LIMREMFDTPNIHYVVNYSFLETHCTIVIHSSEHVRACVLLLVFRFFIALQEDVIAWGVIMYSAPGVFSFVVKNKS
jgi:hypothetical protein